MKKYLLLSLMLVLVPALRADEPKAKPAEAAKPIVVPFELTPTGHMTVMVKVNGKGPYKLIFDTGAPITLMNNKVAKEAGLLKGIKKPLFTFFGSMGDVKVPELEVGGQKLKNTVAIVMDHPTVEAISKAFGPIEGIVGFPFFARFKMTLDYQAKTMTFVPSGYEPPDVLKSMQAALMSGLMGGSDGPMVLSTSATWGLTVHKKDGDDAAGVTVTKVLPKGPAGEAGLKVGDRLLTLDSRWTDTVADTFRAAGAIKPGKATIAVIKRDGKEMKLTIKPISGL
jgi:hypothetical protein